MLLENIGSNLLSYHCMQTGEAGRIGHREVFIKPSLIGIRAVYVAETQQPRKAWERVSEHESQQVKSLCVCVCVCVCVCECVFVCLFVCVGV